MPLDRARFEARVDRSGVHHMWLGAASPAGGGQVRVDGKLLTAARAAWEIENGPVPDGVRVVSCADEPACVRVGHLRLDQRAISSTSPLRKRSPRGAGTIAAISPGVWKIGVTAGVDRLGQRRRTFRTIYGTRKDAATALAALVTEIGDGHRLLRQDDKQLTLDSLVAWYLEFARQDRGLDHSTLTGYADAYSHWLKEPIGHKRASSITTAELDKAFDRMCRAGLSRSRMNNARALLSGAFKWGKCHGKVTSNPVDGFELPTSTHPPHHPTAPELDELLRLLATAGEHDEVLAPVLKLAASTGLRRGELSGLRRDRLHLDLQELIVDTAINDAGGIVVEKQTKTRSSRAVSLDGATVDLLRQHLAEMDTRAAACDASVASDGFVFSLDPTCSTPLRPELLTRRMRQLRKEHGLTNGSFDTTILALRKWTTTELLDAGFSGGELPPRSDRAPDPPPRLLDPPPISRQGRRAPRTTNPRQEGRIERGRKARWKMYNISRLVVHFEP
jgi:integrase